MIQPTAKASSLPDDLKAYWSELMAEKYPMNLDEAMAFCMKHAPSEKMSFSKDTSNNLIRVNYYETIEVPEGQYPPSNKRGWYRQHAYESPMVINYTVVYARNIQDSITDLKPSAIKKKLNQIVED